MLRISKLTDYATVLLAHLAGERRATLLVIGLPTNADAWTLRTMNQDRCIPTDRSTDATFNIFIARERRFALW